MAVAFGAIGTKAGTGTTTEAIAYPASVGAGDLLLACRSIWLGTATADDEAGWTSAGELSGGTGSAVDDHTTVVAADWIEAAGGETGTVTFDQTGATGIMAVMLRYTKGAGTWDVASQTGDDAAHGADRAVTLSSSHTVAVGDFVVAVVAVDNNTTLAGVSSPTFSGTATFGTVNRRTSGTGTSTGNDGNIEVWDAEVTGAGTCTGFSFTTSTSQCGPIDIVRLREVAGGTDGTVVAVPATATATAITSVLTAAASIVAVLAAMTATAPPPTVAASSTVTAVVATATATAPIPAVEASTTLEGGGPATATAQAHPPVVSAGVNGTVAGVTATATATAVAPVVTSTALTVATSAATTAAAGAPGVSASSAIVGVTATSTADAVPPSVASGVTIAGTTATATAAAVAPVVETFITAAPAPSERTLVVPVENRVLVVPSENRTMEA